MAYKRNRNYTLDRERDVGLNVAPEGTPVPDRVCIRCAHYRKGGYCEERRKDVGPLWEACNKYTTETPKPQDTMEKTETPTTKVCKRCGRELPLEAFAKNRTTADGLQKTCRECAAEMNKAYNEKKKAHAFTFKKEVSETPVAANPALAELPDHDLVNELRRRGYDVKCSKTIEL